MDITVHEIGEILENGSNSDIKELTVDDCLRFLAHCSGKDTGILRSRFRKLKEGLRLDD
jgi:hypothetical protein